ncbi:hypothetical protein JEM67_00510 (plasmid) [Serratia sp. PAMC26656]|uniref:hypothetical protein n=1 Tax=Serratia sp. PAMC26656 TaxID=2775909 RepID=UPI0018F38ED8|nr:hypothetical protein [Serratia sp. PAMC26656]MBJ7889479.1 hypothetical protein [Serratia sp. PAMC26656]
MFSKTSGTITQQKQSLILVPLISALLMGCNDDNKQQFESAKIAALEADDPFLELDAFRQHAGNYGAKCRSRFNTIYNEKPDPCNTRVNVEKQIVMASIDKGSIPAIIFLFKPYSKSPPLYPFEIDKTKANKLASQLVKRAESAPVGKESQALLMIAGHLLQSGKYVSQDSQKAAEMYIKAWQSGNDQAAMELINIYYYLKKYRQAYFWQVRVGSNAPPPSQLSEAEILDIQRKAAEIR